MGLIIGVGDTKPKFPYDYYYGVKIDTTVADTQLERVGRAELHRSLPVHSRMRRCLLDDDGNVVTYLHATDSTETDTGAEADLTGASGMVMVEIPEHYRKFEFNGKDIYALVSEYPLPGFHKVRKVYRSAYEASVERATNKLASVANATAAYRGGNNTAGWDGTYRSLLGMPATDISLTNFRKYARNRGAAGLNGCGWNCDLYEAVVNTYWLFVIEYANLNCKADYTAELTSEGYKRGGLGAGVAAFDDESLWSDYNDCNPYVPCGVTNRLGNATGLARFGAKSDEIGSVIVPSYRGIENPFGHIWSWADGLRVEVQSEADGGKSVFYRATDDNPANFQNDIRSGYSQRGEIARGSDYVKQILCGEFGDILPLSVGADSTTYFTDSFYTNTPANGIELFGVSFGGYLDSGDGAGLASALVCQAPRYADASIGSRLCFIPTA